jgi:hypothetical protein
MLSRRLFAVIAVAMTREQYSLGLTQLLRRSAWMRSFLP